MRFDNRKLATFKKIRLGDVLAASSCFPAGFEPVNFPEDYTYEGLSAAELRESVRYENYLEEKLALSDRPDDEDCLHSFGMMDGGIDDNQGLKSLMLADKKRRDRVNPAPFDLMMVTDVASYFMDPYVAPRIELLSPLSGNDIGGYIALAKKWVGRINCWQWLLFLMAASLGFAAYFFSELWVRVPVLGGATLGLFLLIWYLKRQAPVKEAFRKIPGFRLQGFLDEAVPTKCFVSPVILGKLLGYLEWTKLNVLQQMLAARLSSVISMVMDVNLKQVRRLIFEMFYNDLLGRPAGAELYL